MKVNTKNGFTLVELLVIISILGVLSAVSIPNLLTWIPDYKLRSASRELHDNLQLAKISAIKARETCYIGFNSPVNDQYTVVLGSNTLKVVDLDDYGSNVQFSGAPSRISFLFNGLTDGAATVDITNSDKTYEATVLISGSIKLEKK